MTPELKNAIRSLLDLVKASRQYRSHDTACQTVFVNSRGFVICDETRACTCDMGRWTLRVAAVEAKLEKTKE